MKDRIRKIIFLLLAFACLVFLCMATRNRGVLVLLIGVFVFLAFKKDLPKAEKKPIKSEPNPEPIVEKKPMQKKYQFKVTGSSFDNSDGTNRQDILKKIPKRIIKAEDEKLFGGFTLKDMEEQMITEVSEYEFFEFDCKAVETTFDGKYAVEVYLLDDENREYLIGYIKKDDLELFRRVYPLKIFAWLEIYGGKVKDCLGKTEERQYSPYLWMNCKIFE